MKEGQRDEYGLELIDGIFSSPVPPPPKINGTTDHDNNDNNKNKNTGVAPEPTSVLTERRLHNSGRTSLPPPRARSPIKTKLNSPPRRPPSAGPSSSPFRHINRPPDRGFPCPSPAVRRRLNFSAENASPSLEHLRLSPTRRHYVAGASQSASKKPLYGRDRSEDIHDGRAHATSPRLTSDPITDGGYDVPRFEPEAENHRRDVPNEKERAGDLQQAPPNKAITQDLDDWDDSMQLVQYDDYQLDDRPNNDVPAVNRIPTPRAVPVRQRLERSPTLDVDILSPLATTFAVKIGRGRPPKPRKLVSHDLTDSDVDEEREEDHRPRKLLRDDQNNHGPLRDRYLENPVALGRKPNTRTMPASKNITAFDDQATFVSSKRGPGRPKKVRESEVQTSMQSSGGNGAFGTPKRGPGRPRKVPESSSDVRPGIGWSNGVNTSTPKRGPGGPKKVQPDALDMGYARAEPTQVSLGDGTDNIQVVKRKRGRPRKSESMTAEDSATLENEWRNVREYTEDDLDRRIERGGPIDPILLGHSYGGSIGNGLNNVSTFKQREESTVPKISQQLVTAPAEVPVKRGRGRPKGSKNKPKFKSDDAAMMPVEERTEPWEEDPGVVNGAVKLWDQELESSLDYLVEDGKFCRHLSV